MLGVLIVDVLGAALGVGPSRMMYVPYFCKTRELALTGERAAYRCFVEKR